ncbi:MAG: DUF4265 domain-containing protein [Steroidobacteraceae bacterium]
MGGGSPERLWAKRLPSDRAYFELRNSPFFAKGVSYMDVVEATEDPDCAGEFEYRRTLSNSGHSTYRILVPKKSESFAAWWARLASLECTYEYADEGAKLLYAVDVPPAADIFEVYKILEEGERQSIWVFDEGHCGHSTDRRSAK